MCDIVGLSDWDEDEIMAQVIAESQEEYLQSLKKHAYPRESPFQGHPQETSSSMAYSMNPANGPESSVSTEASGPLLPNTEMTDS